MSDTIMATLAFADLSDTAKQAAKDDYRALFGYDWTDEAMKSLRAFVTHMRARIVDVSVDFFNEEPSRVTFVAPPFGGSAICYLLSDCGRFDPETLKGLGDCVFTGYYLDESLVDGFRARYVEGCYDMELLLHAAFDQWLRDAQADCADFYTDERFAEHCDVNKYRFDVYGYFVGRED